MKVLWTDSPLTSQQVVSALSAQGDPWHPKTVRTLLNRLVKKKALAFSKDGRTYFYSPLVTEKQCQGAASESFLDRVFGGSLQPFLAHFVDAKKLTPAELDDLKKLLKGKSQK
jgi:BlaI family penicillinase repressor